jgi:broad specificity phosphatase PhoE
MREWDYGDYEGTTTKEIRKQVPNWDLWRDGCPNGDSPESMTKVIEKRARKGGGAEKFGSS